MKTGFFRVQGSELMFSSSGCRFYFRDWVDSWKDPHSYVHTDSKKNLQIHTILVFQLGLCAQTSLVCTPPDPKLETANLQPVAFGLLHSEPQARYAFAKTGGPQSKTDYTISVSAGALKREF